MAQTIVNSTASVGGLAGFRSQLTNWTADWLTDCTTCTECPSLASHCSTNSLKLLHNETTALNSSIEWMYG